MTPNVYGETLFQENILSPFHRTNRRYYRYSVTPLPYGMAQVYAYPRIKKHEPSYTSRTDRYTSATSRANTT